jgi:cell division septum initiation protein DivIVA
MNNKAKRDKAKLIEDLKREIQERALLLSDLEVMIEDYQRERLRLLQELKSLKEGLWELTTEEDSEGDDVSAHAIIQSQP